MMNWLFELFHLCNEKGCRAKGEKLFFPFGEEDKDAEHIYLCYNHMQENGFCFACGGFWGGVESFDFSKHGLCDNCLCFDCDQWIEMCICNDDSEWADDY